LHILVLKLCPVGCRYEHPPVRNGFVHFSLSTCSPLLKCV